MEKSASIVVTGAAGFIGSCMVSWLNSQGFGNLILVDDFGVEAKRPNWEKSTYTNLVERQSFFEWVSLHQPKIDLIIHLGARTDTTEFDYAIHEALNLVYSQQIWKLGVDENIPLVYASSAATYGNGALGYKDDHSLVEHLEPLNPYGVSKNEFDKWALAQSSSPPSWAGLKFFNVYGPNEYHKGRMASVIWHSVKQIRENGQVKLFRSHRPDFKDGQQLRDFIYVKDLLEVIGWMSELMLQEQWGMFKSGLYNLGTGIARSFQDLAIASFKGLDMEPNIDFIDMPIDIRDKYQYFTEANMQKLRDAGYDKPFFSLESGVDDYVRNYLKELNYY